MDEIEGYALWLYLHLPNMHKATVVIALMTAAELVVQFADSSDTKRLMNVMNASTSAPYNMDTCKPA